MDDETNGAIDLKDVRKLARGASALRRFGSLLGGRRRRTVRRSATRKPRTTRAARSATAASGVSWKALVVFAVVLFVWWLADGGAKTVAAPASPEVLTDGLWWEGSGIVEKVLPDDTTPPRHQRFFLRDDRGRSLFFAHNVDEAPRVPDLREGDRLSFRGEWRDNEMGGAMHWTHAGSGRRKGGWLERGGVRFE